MTFGGIIKGGLLAGLFINVSEFVLNTFVVPVPEEMAGSIAVWVGYAFVLGILTAYLYAVARPRWGAGPKSAASAGIFIWVLHALLPTTGAVNMGAIDSFPTLQIGWTLVEMMIAGLIAGSVHSEA